MLGAFNRRLMYTFLFCVKPENEQYNEPYL